MRKTILLLATFLSSPAIAATAEDSADGLDHPIDDDETIIVTADYVDEFDILAGTSVIARDNILRRVQPQIGDVLTGEPGVSATSFGPGASRPVLRGLQGERVRVLTDGIGTLDVSNTSADHAVTIDPLTTDRIEVFRGPAALLFGSQAIGGAVNAIDRRIPRVVPENGYHFDLLGNYATAFDETSIGGAVELALSDQFVVHVDGSFRETSDLEVGGFVLTPALRAEQLEVAAEELEEGNLDEAAEAQELAALRDVLPNSFTETYTFGAGFALINDRGSLGASFGYYDTRYGIPARPGAEDHHGEEGEEEGEEEEAPVSIDLQQWRADLRGEIFTSGGFLQSIRFRAGYSNYEHTEFEGDEVGTVFDSEGFEARLELIQADRDGWRGVTGLQASTRDFIAVGAEAFVPPNITDQYGLFTLQELEWDKIGLEFSARYEKTDVRSDSVAIGLEDAAVIVPVDRNFNAFSVAAGANYSITPDVRLGLNASRVERAPSAEELFSNGPHVATQAFEIGNPFFEKETAWGLEAYLRGESGPARFQLAAYHNWFDDFIYEIETGGEADGLPIFQFLQSDARYWGFEAQMAVDVVQSDDLTVTVDAVADYVRAMIEGSGPAPRIPPLRLFGGVEANTGTLGGRVEVEWVDDQNRTTDFELPTDGHTLVNASVSWKPLGAESEHILILSADNIFDVDARRHASFTKDFVPLSGRNIKLSARISF
ncbi:iron complex outermembrane recepter protein [Parasphingorhabdus marina DSM 22363]|uniref:Iron complex outermembrane recepter protein n=1 Tax=Parasphingorhabdus marina DSM 22363 TaxID=1123272 RepID=A0A1N6D0G9_9SPHN|nr:TonB-dependent receptor [Parasphingorhabdus marina]SIN64310.1 iron complex outermembrane recepter protein [Parasphingorhabdus marina DSM 22363]